MAIDSDTLVDRRRLKRQLTLWRVFAIVAFCGLIVAAIGRVGDGFRSDYIAEIAVDGMIFDDRDRDKALAQIAEDERAKALIVSINSPGGTVVGGEALFKRLRRIADKKPVVAVMGQTATSAAYMAALATDRIFAYDGTITGSIGVIIQTTEVTELLKSIGISSEAIKSGPLKAAPSPFERMTPEVRAATKSLVDDIYNMFVDMVSDRRGIPRDETIALADGRVFSGRVALKRGLIDQIGGRKEAVEWLENNKDIESKLPVREIDPEDEVGDWFDRASTLTRKIVLSERLTLDGLISVWHPQLQ